MRASWDAYVSNQRDLHSEIWEKHPSHRAATSQLGGAIYAAMLEYVDIGAGQRALQRGDGITEGGACRVVTPLSMAWKMHMASV
jgi:hypothetical protein